MAGLNFLKRQLREPRRGGLGILVEKRGDTTRRRQGTASIRAMGHGMGNEPITGTIRQ